MEQLIGEYLYILELVCFVAVLSVILFFVSHFNKDGKNGKYHISYGEKVSAYECGFNPFEMSINRFDVQFYLVAIIFIVFDIEISYVFPLIFSLNVYSIFTSSLFIIFCFVFILLVGYLYEVYLGILDWI